MGTTELITLSKAGTELSSGILRQPISAFRYSPGSSKYSAVFQLLQCHCQLGLIYLKMHVGHTGGSPVILVLLIGVKESLPKKAVQDHPTPVMIHGFSFQIYEINIINKYNK